MATKKTVKKKTSYFDRGELVSYDYRGTRHTGTIAGVARPGTTKATTVLIIRPSQHFKGENATIHRHADKVRRASKPIYGHSHIHD